MKYSNMFALSQLPYDDFIDYLKSKNLYNAQLAKLLNQYDLTLNQNIQAKEQILNQIFSTKNSKVEIIGKFLCTNGSNISLKPNVYINYCGTFVDCAPINLGNHVMIGPHSRLLAGTDFLVEDTDLATIKEQNSLQQQQQITELISYAETKEQQLSLQDALTILKLSQKHSQLTPAHKFQRQNRAPSINIGDNVWIGANVTIAAGVTIGKNTIIGAHSLVLEDLPDNVIAFGRPCKVYRPLTQLDSYAFGKPFAQQELTAFLNNHKVTLEQEFHTKYQGINYFNPKTNKTEQGLDYVLFKPLPQRFIQCQDLFKTKMQQVCACGDTKSVYVDLPNKQHKHLDQGVTKNLNWQLHSQKQSTIEQIDPKNAIQNKTYKCISQEQQYKLQAKVLKQFVYACGSNLEFSNQSYLEMFHQISIADQVKLGKNLIVLASDWIKIGNNVKIGQDCSILAGVHPFDVVRRNTSLEFCAPITIEDDVIIGDRVVICLGVTIGKGAVIASNTVIKKDVQPNSFAYGVPCTVINNTCKNYK